MHKILKKDELFYRENTSDLFIMAEQKSYERFMGNIEGKVVLDVGGHIGSFACLAISKGAKKVVSVEAHPENYSMLLMNRKNGMQVFLGAVVSTKDEFVTFYESKSPMNHTTVPVKGRKTIQAKCVNFSELLEEHKPYCVKIDIEGGEYDLTELYDLPECVKLLIIELHAGKEEFIPKMHKLAESLKKQFSIIGKERKLPTHKSWNVVQGYQR